MSTADQVTPVKGSRWLKRAVGASTPDGYNPALEYIVTSVRKVHGQTYAYMRATWVDGDRPVPYLLESADPCWQSIATHFRPVDQ